MACIWTTRPQLQCDVFNPQRSLPPPQAFCCRWVDPIPAAVTGMLFPCRQKHCLLPRKGSNNQESHSPDTRLLVQQRIMSGCSALDRLQMSKGGSKSISRHTVPLSSFSSLSNLSSPGKKLRLCSANHSPCKEDFNPSQGVTIFYFPEWGERNLNLA